MRMDLVDEVNGASRFKINGPSAHSLIWQCRDFPLALLLVVILKSMYVDIVLNRGSQSRAHSIIQAPKLCFLHFAPPQLDKSQGLHHDFPVQIFQVAGRNSIKLEGEENRRNFEMKGERVEQELCPVYYESESVSGRVDIRLKNGRKFQHDRIRIELIGNIGKNACAKGWKNP